MNKVSNDIRGVCTEFINMKIREISEEFYSAAWMNGIEYKVWDAVIQGGTGLVSEEDARLLKAASEAIGGWLAWSDHVNNSVFIPISEWNRMCNEENFDEKFLYEDPDL